MVVPSAGQESRPYGGNTGRGRPGERGDTPPPRASRLEEGPAESRLLQTECASPRTSEPERAGVGGQAPVPRGSPLLASRTGPAWVWVGPGRVLS